MSPMNATPAFSGTRPDRREVDTDVTAAGRQVGVYLVDELAAEPNFTY